MIVNMPKRKIVNSYDIARITYPIMPNVPDGIQRYQILMKANERKPVKKLRRGASLLDDPHCSSQIWRGKE